MKAIRFSLCLFTAIILATLSGHAAGAEDFQTFLKKFTSSASFQYSRVKFPLKSPITLLEDDGETERNFPFTKEKWALLDEETLKEGTTTEAGYEESEFSLRVVFDLINDKWYVTDCYTDWYNLDLPISELKETIHSIQEENKAFEETNP